jgi:hypothetical protein
VAVTITEGKHSIGDEVKNATGTRRGSFCKTARTKVPEQQASMMMRVGFVTGLKRETISSGVTILLVPSILRKQIFFSDL